MACPNKNDINWKVLVNALGETAAHAVFLNVGVPDIINHPNFKANKNKLSNKKLVLSTLAAMQEDENQFDDFAEESRGARNHPLLSNKRLRLNRTNAGISKADSEGDHGKADALRKERDEIEEDIKAIEKSSRIEDIIEYGNKDLNMADAILSKDHISDSELDLARKTMSMWAKGVDLFMDEDEREMLDAQKVQLQVIAGEAGEKLSKIDKLSLDNIERFVRENNGKGIIQTIGEDISWIKGQTLDVSQISDSVVNTLFQSVKRANSIARGRAEKVADELERLSKPLKKKYGMKKVYDMLAQKYENGKMTGSLIVKISPEYQEAKFKKRQEYLQYSGKDQARFQQAKGDYINFLNENEITMDVRKLFGDMEGRAEHVAELKRLLGEAEFERRMDLLKNKVQAFERELESRQIYYEAEYGVGEEANRLLAQWNLEHSPYEWSNYLENPKDPRFNKIRPRGYENTYSVPSKDKWYDKRFLAIEADQDLMAYYQYLMTTMNDLAKVLPDDKKGELKANSIPFIEKNVAEIYDEDGLRSAAQGIWDNLLKATRSREKNQTFFGYQDPVTGEEDSYLRAPNVEDKTKISETYRLLRIAFKEDHDRDPSQAERNELYKQARVEVAEAKSFDLNKVISAYALMTESYVHKGAIEDQVKLIKHYVNNLRESEIANGRPVMNRDGSEKKLSVQESFKNTKAAVGSFVDVAFYDKGNAEEGVTNQDVLTKEEKALKEKYEKMLTIPNLTKSERNFLNKKLAELGGKRTWSRIGNQLLRWIQLKGMGWNVLAGVSNIGFGTISNWTHAAGGEDFSMKNFAKAQTLAWNTVTGKSTKNGKKISNLMKKFDVLKESSNELGRTNLSKFMKKYGPYNINRRAEIMNQSPVMIALMMEEGIWDDFNEDGEYTGNKDFSLEGKDYHKFKAKLDQIVKSLHGNYDPDAPLLAKRKWSGRALTQFRTWMFESFANRFEEVKHDEILDRVRKGRYRSFKKEHMLVLPALRDFYKAFRGQYTDGTSEGDADQANLRKNAVELSILLSLVITMMMLNGDDDDEKKSMMRNMLINQLLRLQTDITFYVDPVSFESLTKQSVPAMSIVTDTTQLLGASWQFMFGEDEISNGIFTGDSRLTRETAQYFPVTTQFYRMYSTGSQIFDKR